MTIQQQLKQHISQRNSLLAFLTTGKGRPQTRETQLKIIHEIAAIDRQVQLLEMTPFKDRNKPAPVSIIKQPSKINS